MVTNPTGHSASDGEGTVIPDTHVGWCFWPQKGSTPQTTDEQGNQTVTAGEHHLKGVDPTSRGFEFHFPKS